MTTYLYEGEDSMLEIVKPFLPIDIDRDLFMKNATNLANEINERDAYSLSSLIQVLSELHDIAKEERRTIVVAGRKLRILLIGIRPPKFRGERVISWVLHLIFHMLMALLLFSAYERRKKDIIRKHKNEIKKQTREPLKNS
jgi:hypothetical protein